jgi:HAD superfamily hydrolase (TIGR01484 family)
MIDAVVFDLDGTALPSGMHSVPSQAMIDAVEHGRRRLKLSAATGRSWGVCYQVLRTLRLTEPCVIAGGTQIVNPVTGEIVWQALLEPDSARRIADFIHAHNYNHAHTSGLSTEMDLINFRPERSNIMYVLDIPTAELQPAIDALWDIPHVTISKAPSWNIEDGADLHITPDIATKEHAIRELAAINGVPTSRTAGVGDAHNDLHLFNAVGHKVAMGNAVPELKAAADEVIESVDNDGLAKYILSLC